MTYEVPSVRASYQTLLGILKVSDAEVHSLFRVGSRVYGCDTWASDEDFVAVLHEGKKDLRFRHDINITVTNVAAFQASVDAHSIFALECVFAPSETVLKAGSPFAFKLDRAKLANKAIATSAKDYTKAVKLFAVELDPSKRKLYHSLRVLLFARQIFECGRIEDFGQANTGWTDIWTNPSTDLADYLAVYGPHRDELLRSMS